MKLIQNVSGIFKEIISDKFKRYLFLCLIATGLFSFFYPQFQQISIKNTKTLEIHFFFHPNCGHCKEQKKFNAVIEENFPVKFILHDVSIPSENALFHEFVDKYKVNKSHLGVPATFFGKYHFIGFHTPETTGRKIVDALEEHTGIKSKIKFSGARSDAINEKIHVPLFGDIDIYSYSIPVLAIVLGLIDGFNPCAMWVLAYLISLIICTNDKRKIWLLVGSFVLASGILYFLFMSAWLNVFLLIGYMRNLTILIALFALWIGINDLKTFFTQHELSCKIGSPESKKNTIGKIEKIVNAPLNLVTILGIITLAFVVNSIEFACSSALPVIFTQVLTVKQLPIMEYYLYILFYVFFFMLDDLIIFGLTAFAVSYTVTNKYSIFCKLIGGIILVIVGVSLILTNTIL